MIPLRDDVPSRTFPLVNYGLIAINALFFLAELGMGANLERFFYKAAVIPALYLGEDGRFTPGDIFASSFDADLGSRVLLAMFLHGGWAHFLGNMLYLWIFGDNVEDRFGHVPYLIFYLLCGLAATFAQLVFSMDSNIPNLGASGAIAGVLGAYIMLFPGKQIRVLLGNRVGSVSALIVIGLWIILQLFSGVASITTATADTGGVAFMAHIGGFVAGLLLTFLFRGNTARQLTR